jgi:hypothetical protein
LATLGTATGNEVFGSVLLSPAFLTPPNKRTNTAAKKNTKKKLKAQDNLVNN